MRHTFIIMKYKYLIVILICSLDLILCDSSVEPKDLKLKVKNGQFQLEESPDKSDSFRDVYEGCGTEEKQCIGDSEGCVEAKNCIFMGSSIINSTHFTLRYYDRCTFDPKRYRTFQQGSFNPDTIDIKRGPSGDQIITCRKITHKDFKFFFFWIGDKCPLSVNKGLYSIGYYSHEEHLAKCSKKYENRTENSVIIPPSKRNLTHWLGNGVSSVSDIFIRAKKCTADIIGNEYEIVKDVLYITKYSLNADDQINQSEHSKCSGGPDFNVLITIVSLLCAHYFLSIHTE